MKFKMKIVFNVLVLLVSMLLVSFGGQKSEWKGKIEYENGVKVVRNPGEPLYGEIQIELEKDLDIGNEEDENCYFYKSIDIDVDSLGNIYVLDTANYRVQKFDRNGKYVLTFGRRGQGPGEFSGMAALQIDKNDRICVLDRHKIHVFTESGELEICIGLKDNCSQFSFVEESRIIGRVSFYTAEGITEEIVLLDREGKRKKSYVNSFLPVFRIKNMVISGGGLYNPRLHFCPWSEGSAIYGHSSEYKVFFLDSFGTIAFIAEIEEPPIAITQKERNEFYEKRYDSEKRMESRFPGREPLSMSEIKKAYPMPQNRPFFSRFLSDENGNIYIFRTPGPGAKESMAACDFFNCEGYFLHKMKFTFPPRVIRYGYVYTEKWEQERGFFRIKRFKIKNREQIKERI